MKDSDQALLIYIHGFHSSPLSIKAQQTKQYLQHVRPDIEFIAPQLVVQPEAALMQLKQLIESHKGRPIALMGSSLGGFFALNIGQHFGLRTALINPSVDPDVTIAQYLGEQVQPYTNERYELTTKHIQELVAMQTKLQPHEYQNFMLMLQTGDETLDFRKASARLKSMRAVIEYGGDHSFASFERWLPEILNFLDI